MTHDEFAEVKRLLERLAPEYPILFQAGRERYCAHCDEYLPFYTTQQYYHKENCPWVAARKLIKEFSPNGD